MFQEAEWESVVPLAKHWPSTGEIKFDGYATKYRPELPCVLDNFNLDVSDNEKVETLMLRTGLLDRRMDERILWCLEW